MSGDFIQNFILKDIFWGGSFIELSESVAEVNNIFKPSSVGGVALGRTMMISALMNYFQEPGPGSLQIQTEQGFEELFADINEKGQIRARIKNPAFASEKKIYPELKPSIGLSLGRGTFSMIRYNKNSGFYQSSVNLTMGEVDRDCEYFLTHSNQIKALVNCHVYQWEGEWKARGLLLHALPEANLESYTDLNEIVHEKFTSLLISGQSEQFNTLFSNYQLQEDSTIPVHYKCRCSIEKVRNAIEMLGAQELADIVDKKEEPSVKCDFCLHNYTLTTAEVEKIFLDLVIKENQSKASKSKNQKPN